MTHSITLLAALIAANLYSTSFAEQMTLDDYVSIFEESHPIGAVTPAIDPILRDDGSSPLFSIVPNLPLEEMTRSGTWSFQFQFVRNDGSEQTLSAYRTDMATKPASTLKLFTGWMGFQRQAMTNTYIGDTLKRSDNDQAEKIFQRSGGADRVKKFLAKNNIDTPPESFHMIDGSGLSHSNRVTVGIEIALLSVILKSDQYDTFKKLLAIPGERGSLVRWFQGVDYPIYAKTGTLRDTAALAGFVELPGGTLIFSTIGSYLVEDPRQDNRASYNLIQTLVRKHVEYLLNPPESCVKTGPCYRVPDYLLKSSF